MFYILPILPVLPILIVYILAAILPAIFLLRFIYRHDTVEKEPPGLLALLLLMAWCLRFALASWKVWRSLF